MYQPVKPVEEISLVSRAPCNSNDSEPITHWGQTPVVRDG